MSNLKRLQDKLAQDELAAFVVTSLPNVRWVSGFTGSAGTVIVTPKEAAFISDGRYTIQASEQVTEMPTHTTTTEKTLAWWIGEKLSGWNIGKVAFEGDFVTYNGYKDWCEKLPQVEWFGTSNLCGELAMVKTPDEIARIRKACALTDLCFDRVLRHIQVGVSELDIALEIEFFFKRQGAQLAFDPIVVSGERSALPHGQPSDKKLEMGDFVTMDFGAKVDGYCADITRTVAVGAVSERHEEVYAQLLKAQLAAIDLAKPGTEAKALDRVAREVLSEKRLAAYFTHGLGHGLGGVVHDVGRLHATSDTILEPGQVWTIEPGVYIEGWSGARIEDDILITEEGHEILTHSPKNLIVVPPHG
jgi:Xaa-Pro aminopeptidase